MHSITCAGTRLLLLCNVYAQRRCLRPPTDARSMNPALMCSEGGECDKIPRTYFDSRAVGGVWDMPFNWLHVTGSMIGWYKYGLRNSSHAMDTSHKSHNAQIPYPTMHHFGTEMCTCVHISVTKWCIGRYSSDSSWDLWDGSVVISIVFHGHQVIAKDEPFHWCIYESSCLGVGCCFLLKLEYYQYY